MPSPNENSRQMQAWLQEANAANFDVDEEYGKFTADTDDNSSADISAAGTDGSLDTD